MARARVLELVQALLAALPLCVLAWPGPGAPLVGQLYPELAGTGIVAMAALAATLLVVVRRAPARFAGSTALLGFVAVLAIRGFGVVGGAAALDTLEARRELLLLLSGAGLALACATLGAAGRAALVRCAIAASLVFSLGALLGVQGRFFGTLGNTGATAAAALPGALAGALTLVQPGPRFWRGLGAAALVAFAGYAASAPALTGLVALFAVLLAAVAVLRRERRALVLTLGAALLALGLAQLMATLPATGARAEITPGARGDLGGGGVRLSIARGALAMLGDRPLLGIGPGQFRASFPPYRDVDELERSNAGAAAGTETEVEHAHDDWLQGVVEGGIVGGVLWLWFLVTCARAAWSALRGDESERRALGAAVLALLVCAALRSALLFDPASSSVFFACAGAVLARPSAQDAASPRMRMVAVPLALLLGFQLPAARAFVRHGAALRLVPTGSDDPARDRRPPGPAELERALDACPDSAMALGLYARARDATGDGAAFWERLLALRPHNLEALAQLALARARAGRESEARELWQRALRVNPRHAPILRNLALSAARAGDAPVTQAALAQLAAAGRLERAWLVGGAATEILSGRDAAGALLLEQQQPERFQLLAQPAEVLYAESQARAGAAAPEEALFAEALACRAQAGWAREHARAGRFDAAVRSYRQALLASARGLGQDATQGAALLHLELAAACLGAGHPDEAREEVARARPTARDWANLPEWAGELLLEAGLLASE